MSTKKFTYLLSGAVFLSIGLLLAGFERKALADPSSGTLTPVYGNGNNRLNGTYTVSGTGAVLSASNGGVIDATFATTSGAAAALSGSAIWVGRNNVIISGSGLPGEDDTLVYKTAYNTLKANGGGVIQLSGTVTVSGTGLDTYYWNAAQLSSNMTLTGGVLRLSGSSNINLLGNHQTGNFLALTDSNICVIDTVLDCNALGQTTHSAVTPPGATFGSGYGPEWVYGAWFNGVNGLYMDNVLIRNASTFSLVVGESENISILNCTSYWDGATQAASIANQDGIHLWGTMQNCLIASYSDIGGSDDDIAINTDEDLECGDIRRGTTGGSMRNITIRDTRMPNHCIRIYTQPGGGGSGQDSPLVMDQVSILNTTGSGQSYGFINSASGLTIGRFEIDGWHNMAGFSDQPAAAGNGNMPSAQAFGTLRLNNIDAGTYFPWAKAQATNWSGDFLAATGTATSGASNPNQPLAFWPLNDGAGVWLYADNAGNAAGPYWATECYANALTGTTAGINGNAAVSFGNGNPGYTGLFQGSIVNQLAPLTSSTGYSFTITGWINPTSVSGTMPILAAWNGNWAWSRFELGIKATHWYWNCGSNTAVSGTSVLTSGTWQFFALEYVDSSSPTVSFKLGTNNWETYSCSAIAKGQWSSFPLRFGIDDGFLSQYAGAMADFKIYNSIPSNRQLNADYVSPGNPAGAIPATPVVLSGTLVSGSASITSNYLYGANPTLTMTGTGAGSYSPSVSVSGSTATITSGTSDNRTFTLTVGAY